MIDEDEVGLKEKPEDFPRVYSPNNCEVQVRTSRLKAPGEKVKNPGQVAPTWSLVLVSPRPQGQGGGVQSF